MIRLIVSALSQLHLRLLLPLSSDTEATMTRMEKENTVKLEEFCCVCCTRHRSFIFFHRFFLLSSEYRGDEEEEEKIRMKKLTY